MPDDIPSLADLRRTRTRKSSARATKPTPTLFDPTPEPPRTRTKPSPSAQDQNITAADILAEQSRALITPSSKDHPTSPPSPSAQDVFTVGELVRRIRTLVERTHGHVTVEGEISNWRPAASGHCYFTLKDAEAQLSIVLFRRQAALLRFRPKDGDAVRISGSLSVYESRGQLQLVAETMQQTGLGALLAATQALKDRLRRESLFENQRPLPPFPRCIGVVTSLHGAALRDIVKVCRRRHAAVNLLIYPAAVQGPNCPAEIAAGIHWFSNQAKQSTVPPQEAVPPQNSVPPQIGVPRVPLLGPGKVDTPHPHELPRHDSPTPVDVVLVARGGGSWEDLHGFDAEIVARAIAACSVPVITGIGHATDTTIADAAADLHAPTPSAAAELLTAAQHDIADRLTRLHSRLSRANRYNLLRLRQRLSGLDVDSILRRTRTTLERRAQHLDELTYRAETSINRTLRTRNTRLLQLESRLRRQHVSLRVANDAHRFASLQQRLHAARTTPFLEARTRLAQATSQLQALSPLRVLERGYALIYLGEGDPNDRLLRNATEAPPGTPITAQLAHGRLRAKVTRTE
jgi:exodeoxyribonuclease VII large subunit